MRPRGPNTRASPATPTSAPAITRRRSGWPSTSAPSRGIITAASANTTESRPGGQVVAGIIEGDEIEREQGRPQHREHQVIAPAEHESVAAHGEHRQHDQGGKQESPGQRHLRRHPRPAASATAASRSRRSAPSMYKAAGPAGPNGAAEGAGAEDIVVLRGSARHPAGGGTAAWADPADASSGLASGSASLKRVSPCSVRRWAANPVVQGREETSFRRCHSIGAPARPVPRGRRSRRMPGGIALAHASNGHHRRVERRRAGL